MNSSLPPSTSPQNFHSEPSIIIQKQSKELQLLMAELKDRDKELNEMVAVHQRQLLAWEKDRQKTLTLAERCNSTENELLKRSEVITKLTNRLKCLESQNNDWKRTLESTQRELQDISQTASDTSLHCRALEEKNQGLNCSMMELSNKVGHLEAREQELLTMLKLKDKDILEATNNITEFTYKFKMLESALWAARMEESSISKEKQDFKVRLKELMFETSKLKDDLSEKTKENNEQREEIIRLKQEISYLNNELMFSDLREAAAGPAVSALQLGEFSGNEAETQEGGPRRKSRRGPDPFGLGFSVFDVDAEDEQAQEAGEALRPRSLPQARECARSPGFLLTHKSASKTTGRVPADVGRPGTQLPAPRGSWLQSPGGEPP
ncbi:PREDICTED: coiled-coil domain-containing protein 62 isoform X5 [Gekko japonicus]|uniref:Coiled-coil domain-containing protein 62 isoform X5 n=1 Tax=Gekko japonicus TaxID=146911 RepID=A0ABM1KHH4_GEKJA|nr:PREDICTED: coiled-coil domain-containing protein 62 isoform X5 [Gekko japonicus]